MHPGEFQTQPQGPGFIAATFQNSWVNFDTTNSQVAFIKDQEGFVHIKGLARSGTMITPIFTLPVGYRPRLRINRATISNGAFGHVTVDPNGEVIPQAGSNGWFSVDGISFKAEL